MEIPGVICLLKQMCDNSKDNFEIMGVLREEKTRL